MTFVFHIDKKICKYSYLNLKLNGQLNFKKCYFFLNVLTSWG